MLDEWNEFEVDDSSADSTYLPMIDNLFDSFDDNNNAIGSFDPDNVHKT